MKKILLLLIYLCAFSSTNYAQYCMPGYTTGTAQDDFIDGVFSGTWANIGTGYAGGPSYTDYSGILPPAGIEQSGAYLINITGGNYIGDVYAAWIDFNGDGDFFDVGEKLGEFTTTTTYETQAINFSVPAAAYVGITRLRVRCTYNTPNIDPCATYTYGEAEDYAIDIASVSGGSYCLPTYTTGTSGGDYIQSVVFGSINNVTGANTIAPYYSDYTNLSTNININGNYNITVQSGNYSPDDYYAIWIDYNQDGVLSATEKIGELSNTATFQNLNFNFTVPASALTGYTLMRVRCVFNGAAMDPCLAGGWGETEDYAVNIIGGGLPPVANYSANFNGTGMDFTDASANNPTSWSWSFPGGTPSSSTAQNPSNIVYTTPGCWGVTLTVTNAYGSNTVSYPCAINVPQANGCSEPFFSEYVEGTVSNHVLEIVNPSAVSINLSQYAIHNYANGATTPTYTLQLTGTLAPYQTYVIADPSASATILALANTTSTVCFFDGNDAITLKKNGVIIDMIGFAGEDPGTAWPINGGAASMQNYTISRNFAVDRPTGYWTDAQNQWTVSAVNTITGLGSHTSVCSPIGQAPTAAFTANVFNITVGQSVNFTDLSTNAPTSRSWTFTGGLPATSTATNPNNIMYNAVGCYTVSLTVSNAFGSDNEIQTCYINVTAGGQAPVAAFTANVFNINVGQSVNFTDLSTNAPTSRSWVFTGGLPATSTATNPNNIVYNAVGCYQVQLTATNAFGSDVETQTCYINVSAAGQAPVAAFTANVFNINVGQSVNFTDLSTNAPTSRSWVFTGGLPATSTATNPNNIVYNTAGCFQVQLTATNAFGSDVETQTCYINVTQPGSAPVAAFTSSLTSGCAGSSINFTDQSLNTPTVWSWSFQGATPSSSSVQNPSNIVYNTAGTFTVTLTVTNANGSNTSAQTNYITVYANPIANAGNPVAICPGGTTTLNATSGIVGAVSYQWTPATGLSNPNIANPVASPTITTTYTVVVANGPCSSVASVVVTVAPVNASAGNDLIICPSETTTLNATGGTSYQWTPATGLSNASIANPVAFPTATTTYTVTVSNGTCTATDQITVTVANPQIFAPADATICQGDTAYLPVVNGQGFAWVPSTGLSSATSPAPFAFPSSTTTYTVTADVNGCPASDQVTVIVNQPPPAPVISLSGYDLMSTTGVTYQWGLNGTELTGATFATVFPDLAGSYTVTISDINGCKATSAPYVVVTVGLNDNNSNNQFTVAPNPVSDFATLTINTASVNEKVTMVLYNALGAIISSQQINVNNRSVTKKIEMANLPAGVYFLHLNGESINAVKQIVKQ